jgi:uroporphyrinogen decarboxylase
MGNPGICSVGHEIEISTAIEHLCDKAVIAGNIAPHILLTGRPQQIYELCTNALEMGRGASRGFMLMSGCETPPDTPPYNIYMMRKAINDFGWY